MGCSKNNPRHVWRGCIMSNCLGKSSNEEGMLPHSFTEKDCCTLLTPRVTPQRAAPRAETTCEHRKKLGHNSRPARLPWRVHGTRIRQHEQPGQWTSYLVPKRASAG